MIRVLNRRADSHPDHCEDAYFHIEKNGWIIAAVFDGCSKSIRSHFASQLHANLLRKILEVYWDTWYEDNTRGIYTIKDILNDLSCQLAREVLATSEVMGLEELETLSTIVIALYHIKSKHLAVKFLGDGAMYTDGEMFRVDSGPDNNPNYIAYLDWEDATNPSTFDSYPTEVKYNVTEWSICTDGIDAMRHVHRPLEECISYLLTDNTFSNGHIMLRRKLNILMKEGMVLGDDLTIIRYVPETV